MSVAYTKWTDYSEMIMQGSKEITQDMNTPDSDLLSLLMNSRGLKQHCSRSLAYFSAVRYIRNKLA